MSSADWSTGHGVPADAQVHGRDGLSWKGRVVRQARRRRSTVATARLYVERHALARRRPTQPRDGGRVLCYHSIGQAEMGVNDVDPTLFRRQLGWAIDAGFRFVTAASIAATGGRRHDLAITFDDAPTSVASNAAPVLRSLDIPFTVFVVTSWADQQRRKYMTWDTLGELAMQGAEIGSHSVAHPRFSRIDEHRMRLELEGSRSRIRACLGLDATSFAIPFGQSSDWGSTAMQFALDAGYDAVYAQAESTRPAGTVPRTFVTRFDERRVFTAALNGAFDSWEEWY